MSAAEVSEERIEDVRTIPNAAVVSPRATSGYISTLSLSQNSSHIGASRSYSYDYFYAEINGIYGVGAGFTASSPAKMTVSVGTKSLISYNPISTTTVNYYTNNQNLTAYLNYVGKGNRAFRFQTYGSAIKSDRVNLISHNECSDSVVGRIRPTTDIFDL